MNWMFYAILPYYYEPCDSHERNPDPKPSVRRFESSRVNVLLCLCKSLTYASDLRHSPTGL